MLKKMMLLVLLLAGILNAANLSLDKNRYNPNEKINVHFSGMTAKHKDWLAIYRAGTSNEWKNVKDWSWTNDVTAGKITFKGLPAGNYEVRAFYNNSYHTEARKQFKVGGNNDGGAATVTTIKASYNHGETVTASFNHMLGNNKDWIAVYRAGTNNEWKNVVQWAWTDGKKQGTKSFRNLPNGNYEVRVFFRNTYHVEARHAFKVIAVHHEPRRILYDDFEHAGIDPRWTRTKGRPFVRLNYGVNKQQIANGNRKVKINGQHSLHTTYVSGANKGSYFFNFQHPAQEFKYLELDMSRGNSSHKMVFGVIVKTKKGNRQMSFAAYYNHQLEKDSTQIYRGPYRNVLPGHKVAHKEADGYNLTYPGPTDYIVGTSAAGAGTNMFIHYKINIDEYLKKLEPDNELYEISYFISSGGDYDNLALTNF